MANALTQPRYPRIPPVPVGTVRPFWSVMIPTYHCAAYLSQTLRSVLEQAPPPEEMQIEIVDDGSFTDDPESVVLEVGGGRAAFFRQPKNVGPQANFTTAVQRARGEWVHILHGDDMVRPGFYAAMRRAAERDRSIGAAFCRVIHINDDGVWLDLSELESGTGGVLPDLIQRLAIKNGIMFPSIVVKRAAYEALGGFHPALFHSADWDMWKRVAVMFPVWYEPEPLAFYREHAASDTSRLMKTGANIADARMAIDIAERYLPAQDARSLSKRARLHHALYAVEIAHRMASRRDWSSAWAQVREGLKCSWSIRVWHALIGLAIECASHPSSQASAKTS